MGLNYILEASVIWLPYVSEVFSTNYQSNQLPLSKKSYVNRMKKKLKTSKKQN